MSMKVVYSEEKFLVCGLIFLNCNSYLTPCCHLL